MNTTAMQPRAVIDKLNGMNIVIDFETYYCKDYTLRKLATFEYIRDSRFKVHGVGIQIDNNEPEWWTDNIEGKLKAINWSRVTLIGHNLYFDASILFERYGIVPARRLDTMSMAQSIFEPGISVSLNSVAQWLDLGHKIAGTLDKTKGIRDLDADTLAELGTYCLQDIRLTREIFDRFIPHIPAVEQNLIDLTLRMSTAPVLELDKTECALAIAEADNAQQTAIAQSNVPRDVLSSNQKFAAYLESLGLEVPVKKSKTTGKDSPALGQNDPEFIQLMVQHPELQHVWDGRAAAKSNIALTRARSWEYLRTHGSCKMPMPLKYYGAHTGRWSGTDKLNVQNLPRGSRLRKAITAPPGHVVLVGDSSQIELRMNAWFSGQDDVLEAQRKGDCVYRATAAKHFDKDPADITKDERQFGKIMVLGCGYGMGSKKFKHFCASGPLGMAPLHLTDEEAADAIRTYRSANSQIAAMWKTLDKVIDTLTIVGLNNRAFKCLKLAHEQIILPNGMGLSYYNLTPTEENGWFFGTSGKRSLWGGTLLENIIQALARIVVAEQMLKVDALPDVRVVGCTHDEILAVCPERYAEIRFNQMISIMSQPPEWALDLPLAAEGGWAQNYSK